MLKYLLASIDAQDEDHSGSSDPQEVQSSPRDYNLPYTPSQSASPRSIAGDIYNHPYERANDKMSLTYILNQPTRHDFSMPSPVMSTDANAEQALNALKSARERDPSLGPEVYHETKVIFHELIRNHHIKPRCFTTALAFIGASLLIALRRFGIGFTFRYVCNLLSVRRVDLMRAYKEANGVLPEDDDTSNIVRIVDGLARDMRFTSNQTQCAKFAALKALSILDGRNIRSVAAVCVYLVAQHEGIHHLTRREVSNRAGVSDVTLWTLSKLLKNQTHILFGQHA